MKGEGTARVSVGGAGVADGGRRARRGRGWRAGGAGFAGLWILAVGLMWVAHVDGPAWEGRRLRHWVLQLDDRPPVRNLAEEPALELAIRLKADPPGEVMAAIRGLGPRALPWLERWYHDGDPDWLVIASGWPVVGERATRWRERRAIRRARALHALCLLGADAAPAVPRMLGALTNRVRHWEAAHALSRIGEPSVASLVTAFETGTEDGVRAACVWSLAEMERPPVEEAGRFLRELEQGTGPLTERMLLHLVVRMDLPADRVLGVYVAHLDHHDPMVAGLARRGLQRLGREAAEAAPAVLELLQSGGPRRGGLVELLYAIDPQAAAAMGLK